MLGATLLGRNRDFENAVDPNIYGGGPQLKWVSVPKNDVRIATFSKIANAVREAGCCRGCGSDGSEGQVCRESIVMGLLSLEQQVTRVGNRVVGLDGGHQEQPSGRRL